MFLKHNRFWEASGQKSSYDLVIIGGGLHGLATAYFLSRYHGMNNIAVLEKRYIGYGGSGRNTAIVRANQLMPKPTHLSWEESAVNGLCSSTSYRMLVSDNGARMKQGDSVLIWGATGGIGGVQTSYVAMVQSGPGANKHFPQQ